MPQSDINQVTFFQEYYLGDPPPFFTSIEDVQTSSSTIQIVGTPAFLGYPYTHDVPSSPPNPDRVLTSVSLETQSNTDSDGVQYGGNFRPDTNDIVVVGNLNPAEEFAVRNALTINEGNLSNNRVTDQYVVNTFNLAGIGISDFGYIIPYSERDIVIPGDTVEIPFFRLRNNGTSRETQITLSDNSPRQLSIDDGTETISEPVMILENMVLPGERDFNQLDIQVTSNDFIITYNETTVDKLIFKLTSRSSSFPSPALYETEFPGTNSIIELALQFDLTFDATGVSTRDFRIRPYAREPERPTENSNQTLNSPPYARVIATNSLSVRYQRIDFNTIKYSLVTYQPSFGGGRQNFNAMTFQNSFDTPIDLEVDLLFNRIRIQGENSLGATVAQVFPFATYITLEDMAQAINEWIATVNGWDGQVSMIVNNPEYNNYCASEYLIELSTTSVNDSQDLTTEIPLILLDDPEYTWTIDISNTTFREVLDVRKTYRDTFGQELLLPVSDTDYGGMPDSWKDWPGLPRCLNSASGTTNPGSRTTNTTYLRGNSYTQLSSENYYLYYYNNSDIEDYSNFNTVQDLCDFFNDEIPFIQASPGLYYGELDSAAIECSGTWQRVGSEYTTNIAETSSTSASKIQIRGGQDNIGGFNNEFTAINFEDNYTVNIAGSTQTIAQLSIDISNRYPGIIFAGPVNGNDNIEIQELAILSPTSIKNSGDSATVNADFERPRAEVYELDNFNTIESLVSAINQDWNTNDIVATVETGTSDRPDAIPSNLIAFDAIQDLTVSDLVLTGNVSEVEPPELSKKFIYLDYNLNWVGNVGPNIDEQGIQVALGGYRSNGEYFINSAPNAFFEPGFNSLFNVTFNVTEAEEVYILVRTRQDADASSYTSNPSDYQGLTRFSNGSPSAITNATQLSGAPFDVWEDSEWNSGNTPAVFIVPAEANIMTTFADDISILDSIQVQINSFPAELDEFAYLALNRTNLNASMTESRQGRAFGLVLDNRGIWDILIGPEAEIRRVLDGEFDYLNFSFDHTTIDSDEAYNYEFFNSDNLDPLILNSINIIPVPGFPKVAVLRIESGVKRYLSQLRTAANPNSLDGCSIDIDILAEGKESGTQGVARVTIFADHTCVYDIGLCDFFWNLSDPPQPAPPDAIQNTLSISYQDYIDCARLSVDTDGDNARLSLPLLITFEGVPVFETGNALLLIKGSYSSSVEGYFFPSKNDFNSIQNSECGNLDDNEPLSDRLNQELVFVEDEEDPITDPVRISQIINGTEPYLYVKPRFQFPGVDGEFECGPNEIIIASIGYQFQDWEPGLRQDDILIGINCIISNSTFSAPELELCYKYYYRREK